MRCATNQRYQQTNKQIQNRSYIFVHLSQTNSILGEPIGTLHTARVGPMELDEQVTALFVVFEEEKKINPIQFVYVAGSVGFRLWIHLSTRCIFNQCDSTQLNACARRRRRRFSINFSLFSFKPNQISKRLN